MKIKSLTIALVSLGGLFILSMFISLAGGETVRNYFFRELAYQIIVEKTTQKAENDSAKAMLLYHFVRTTVLKPDTNELTADKNPFETLRYGKGSCDQQANLLITLAGICGLKGQLVFLFGNDSVSRHSVCELQIGGDYVMFDTFYGQVLETPDKRIAGIDDIQKNNFIKPEKSIAPPAHYFQLFDKVNPYRVFMNNEIKPHKLLLRKTVAIWYSLFNGKVLKTYLQGYFYCDKTNKTEQQRINFLLF